MLLTLIVTKSGTAQQNLIVNGGFDVPDIITDLPPGFQTFNESSAGFGWTIVSDGTPNQFAATGFLGVDLIDRLWSGIGGTSNFDGFDQSVDIDGESSISQTFSTVIGREYTLEFFYLGSRAEYVTAQGNSTLISDTVNLPVLVWVPQPHQRPPHYSGGTLAPSGVAS